MADQELIPADLYVQPPKKLKLRARGAFTQFVQMFPPEYFIEADVSNIVRFLQLERRIEEIEDELTSIEFYITENDMGTQSVHPLIKVYETFQKQYLNIAEYLRISPKLRDMHLPRDVTPGASSRAKEVRMLFKYTDENGDASRTERIADASA
jgi:phage terminase small subunit